MQCDVKYDLKVSKALWPKPGVDFIIKRGPKLVPIITTAEVLSLVVVTVIADNLFVPHGDCFSIFLE